MNAYRFNMQAVWQLLRMGMYGMADVHADNAFLALNQVWENDNAV
jgi:hypothetical protein